MNSKDSNPFAAFDMSKFDFQRIFTDMKLPGVDMQGLLEAQKKNIAALTQANQHAVEGMQSLAKRQLEVLQQTMKNAAEAAQKVATAGGPQEAAAKQAELTKAAFEQALANMRDMAEIVGKSSSQAFSVISQRVSEGMQELKPKS